MTNESFATEEMSFGDIMAVQHPKLNFRYQPAPSATPEFDAPQGPPSLPELF